MKAGIQNGIGDRVGNLVGVAVGYTFRGKESFFHFEFLSFYYTTQNTSTNKEKSHTDGLDVRISNPHLSFAAGFGTLVFTPGCRVSSGRSLHRS